MHDYIILNPTAPRQAHKYVKIKVRHNTKSQNLLRFLLLRVLLLLLYVCTNAEATASDES